MRRPAKPLSAKFVQTVKGPGKFFDGHGLYLRVDERDNRYWVQRIVINGKRREIGIGSYDFVSLAEARVPYSDLPGFLSLLHGSQAGISTKLCLEFLILTCARSLEARGTRWDEIDFDSKSWNVPADRMKMKRAHRVPLSARAIALLRQAEGLDPDLVFPGTIKGKLLSDMTLSKLVKELGFPVHVHGFRTSFRTWTQEMTNFPNEVAENALAHTVGGEIERAYARSDLFEKRRNMMEAWAGFLDRRPAKVMRIG